MNFLPNAQRIQFSYFFAPFPAFCLDLMCTFCMTWLSHMLSQMQTHTSLLISILLTDIEWSMLESGNSLQMHQNISRFVYICVCGREQCKPWVCEGDKCSSNSFVLLYYAKDKKDSKDYQHSNCFWTKNTEASSTVKYKSLTWQIVLIVNAAPSSIKANYSNVLFTSRSDQD